MINIPFSTYISTLEHDCLAIDPGFSLGSRVCLLSSHKVLFANQSSIYTVSLTPASFSSNDILKLRSLPSFPSSSSQFNLTYTVSGQICHMSAHKQNDHEHLILATTTTGNVHLLSLNSSISLLKTFSVPCSFPNFHSAIFLHDYIIVSSLLAKSVSVFSHDGSLIKSIPFLEPVNAICPSSSKNVFFVLEHGHVNCVDLSSPKLVKKRLFVCFDGLYCMCLSPNGNQLAISGKSRNLNIIDTSRLSVSQRIKNVTKYEVVNLRWSHINPCLVIMTSLDNELSVCNVTSSQSGFSKRSLKNSVLSFGGRLVGLDVVGDEAACLSGDGTLSVVSNVSLMGGDKVEVKTGEPSIKKARV
ncbi:hypothetical protein GEMRC1_009744 [Eukaryota sp. GEM-RC1]